MAWLYNRKGNSREHKDSNSNTEHNQYIEKRGDEWVVLNKEGEVMSHHDSKEKAEESFRAMEMHKHGD